MRSPERSSTVPGPSLSLALALPILLLGGAYVAEYGFGLYPCEMCWWQRWPHFAATALAALGFFLKPVRLWITVAGVAILGSAAIGAYHAGVEYGWWQGVTNCARIVAAGPGSSALDAIMNAPVVSCNEAQWRLFGISLAGFNFLLSATGGLTVLALALRRDGT